MRSLRRFLSRSLAWTNEKQDEERLRLEIEEHIALQTSENMRAGLTQPEARRQAVLKFGAIEAIKEKYREQKGIPFMETLLADVRQAWRSLRQNPGFTFVALAALTIGIGANTGIFSVVNKVLLAPLPYPEPDRLVQIGRQYPNFTGYANSVTEYMFWRNNNAFSSMAVYDDDGPGFNLSTGDHPMQIGGIHVSAGYFKVFGIPPLLGRNFTAAEDQPNGPKAAVISENLWRTRFASDPKILDHTITLNSEPCQVVGVMPASFVPTPSAEIWIPLQADPNGTSRAHYLAVAARLKPGVSLPQAQAEMRAVGERFRRAYPQMMDKDENVAVTPLRDAMVSDSRRALYIMLAAVTFVLLIACANVANLLLARSAARQRELAIRAAIGASRGRVIRQLLTESVLLSAMGGILGLLVGVVGVRGLMLLVPGDIPRISDPGQLNNFFALIDWRILIFTVGLSLLTGILFGLFPALQISNPNLASTLKEAGTRSSTSRRQNFTRKTLVAVEMALALILLASAALLIRTFIGLTDADPGIDPRHVLTTRTSLTGGKYQTTEALDLFTRQALQRIESIPGVQAASTSTVLPVTSQIDFQFDIPGKALPAGQDHSGDEQWRAVTSDYFKVFRIPLERGRLFTDHDATQSAGVIIINAAFAQKYFPNENPIGRSIQVGKGAGPDFAEPPRQIVGIVGNVRENGLAGGKVPVTYIPQSQQPDGMTRLIGSAAPLSWAVRSTLGENHLAATITQAIQSVDSQVPLARVESMENVLHNGLSRQSFSMLLLSIFSGAALLLAAIGIYGLMAYSVQQQTQEIGVRMALGASKPALFRLVIRQGLPPALIGVGVGLISAFGLTRLLESLLYGVEPGDPLSFFSVALLLLLVAIAAVLIPARRAMSVNPVTALRKE